MSLSQNSSSKESSFRWAAFLAIAVPSGAAGYAIWKYTNMFGRELSADQGVWGAFGDFIGGSLNPVIGLITISLLVLTLRSQQAEMREQRQQSAKQAFEQTFFTWLNSYRSAIYQFRFRPPNAGVTEKEGVDAMHWVLSYARSLPPSGFAELHRNVDIDTREKQRKQERELTTAWWLDRFNQLEPQLGSIIRTLYTLIRWIDKNDSLSTREKWDYIAIVRAQLSSPELRILFFNGYTEAGEPFTQYIDRYAILDNLPLNSHSEVKWGISAKTHPFGESAFQSELARETLGLAQHLRPY